MHVTFSWVDVQLYLALVNRYEACHDSTERMAGKVSFGKQFSLAYPESVSITVMSKA